MVTRRYRGGVEVFENQLDGGSELTPLLHHLVAATPRDRQIARLLLEDFIAAQAVHGHEGEVGAMLSAIEDMV